MVYLHVTLEIFQSTPEHLHICLPPHIVVFERVQPLNGQNLMLVVLHALVEFLFYHFLFLEINLLVLLSDLLLEFFLLLFKQHLFFLQLFNPKKLLCNLCCLNPVCRSVSRLLVAGPICGCPITRLFLHFLLYSLKELVVVVALQD